MHASKRIGKNRKTKDLAPYCLLAGTAFKSFPSGTTNTGLFFCLFCIHNLMACLLHVVSRNLNLLFVSFVLFFQCKLQFSKFHCLIERSIFEAWICILKNYNVAEVYPFIIRHNWMFCKSWIGLQLNPYCLISLQLSFFLAFGIVFDIASFVFYLTVIYHKLKIIPFTIMCNHRVYLAVTTIINVKL